MGWDAGVTSGHARGCDPGLPSVGQPPTPPAPSAPSISPCHPPVSHTPPCHPLLPAVPWPGLCPLTLSPAVPPTPLHSTVPWGSCLCRPPPTVPSCVPSAPPLAHTPPPSSPALSPGSCPVSPSSCRLTTLSPAVSPWFPISRATPQPCTRVTKPHPIHPGGQRGPTSPRVAPPGAPAAAGGGDATARCHHEGGLAARLQATVAPRAGSEGGCRGRDRFWVPRAGWGPGDAVAVALPPVPEAAGGFGPTFCLLFWSQLPMETELVQAPPSLPPPPGTPRVPGTLRPCGPSPCPSATSLAAPWHPPRPLLLH